MSADRTAERDQHAYCGEAPVFRRIPLVEAAGRVLMAEPAKGKFGWMTIFWVVIGFLTVAYFLQR